MFLGVGDGIEVRLQVGQVLFAEVVEFAFLKPTLADKGADLFGTDVVRNHNVSRAKFVQGNGFRAGAGMADNDG